MNYNCEWQCSPNA